MKERIAAIALALGMAACAAGGGPGSPSPDAALAYAMPLVNPLAFTVADTVSIDMDMGGTVVSVGVRSNATVEASFSPAGEALTAEIRYTEMDGAFTNSMGPSMPLGNDDIPDPATVRVQPDGEVSVVELPEATEAFRQVFGAESAYRRLFVRLPGHAVQPGAMWTDTVTIVEDMGSMASETSQITTSTLAGDTLVDGRRLQIIRSDISGTTRVSGVNQGMEIRQLLHGASTALTLWDPARKTVVERTETGTAQGSMEMPGMGMTGIPVRMSTKSVVRLQTR